MPLLVSRLIVTLPILLSLTVCDKEQKSEVLSDIRPVRYIRVGQQKNGQQRIFSGTAQASLENTLSFRVAGTVIKRPVKVGQLIKPGELIAALDPTDFQVTVKEAQAEQASAQAEARNARANYQRVQGLYENRNAAKSDLDVARAQSESALAGISLAKQRLHSARLQLSYTQLKAADQCAVAALFVKKNENVAAGNPVVRLNCGDQPEVLVAVPDRYIDKVQIGQQVKIVFSSILGKSYQGEVTEVGVASTEAATTFPVTTRLLNPDKAIRSGMAADVLFQSKNQDAQLIVPNVAVGEDSTGRFVFVLEAVDQIRYKALRRSVQVGPFAASGIIIDSGLKAGELIATAGVRRIANGQLVKLLGDIEQ